MPYRNAHWYVLLVMAVIVAGFWETYFQVWNEVPWQFHAHAVAASLWVLMVFGQIWTAHHRQLPLHRAVGRSSLLLFPFLIGGLAAIIDVTAKGYVAGDPLRTALAGPFFSGLAIALLAYLTVYYRALKFRRKVWIHSGYLLTTPLILFESPFSRILTSYTPGFIVRGPEDIGLIVPAILTGMALELAVVGLLWWKYGKKAAPFLVAGLFIAAQMLFMGPLGGLGIFRSLLAFIGELPSATVVLSGMVAGAATSWAGWQAGKAPAAAATARPSPLPSR